MFIKTVDRIKDFQEFSADKGLRQEEKLNKNATAAQMQERMKYVTGGTGLETHQLLDYDEFAGKARAGFVASGSQATCLGDGLLGPEVRDLLQDERTKRRRTAKDGDESEGDEDEDDDNGDGGANARPKREMPTPSPGKGEWLDETKINKAEREFLRSVVALEHSLKQTQSAVEQALAEFRASPEDAKARRRWRDTHGLWGTSAF